MKKQVVSPAASGGAGTLFEYRVAAIMLVDLLCRAHPPGLEIPVDRVGLQQRVRGHLLDDVVVYGRPGTTSTEFQIKRTLTITASDGEFAEVVDQALHVLCDRSEDIALGTHALGLIARGNSGPIDQLFELAEWARGHTDRHTFFEVVNSSGATNEGLRSRLAHVRQTVQTAIGSGAPSSGGADETTHRLLAALQVWRPDVADGGRDYRAALDRLQPIADRFGESPAAIFGHLAALAESWGPRAGVVDADSVMRQLRRRGLRDSQVLAGELQTETIDTDAVVRGPIAALGLDLDLAIAQQLLKSGDSAAVDAFQRLADLLQVKHFTPYATNMLRRRADALDSVGRPDEALLARSAIAWSQLDLARPWEAGFALSDGEPHRRTAPLGLEATRVETVIDAAIWVAKGASFDRYLAKFDKLADGDAYQLRSAVFLCEEALAADRLNEIRDRLDLLEQILTREAPARAADGAERLAVRLQMCMADVTGNWIELIRVVHRTQPRDLVTWALARFGRCLALAGDGAGSQHQYLEAIERACAAEMFDEAADWLYALRTVRYWYDDHASGDEQHPRALALRPLAKPSRLPGSPHTKELALQAMLDESTPNEALQRAYRWRWQAVIRGNLTDELAACRAIGTLHRKAGRPEEAIESYIRAGADKLAKAATLDLPEKTTRFEHRSRLVPRARAVAYDVAAAAVDLLTDDDARTWAREAIAEIAATPTADFYTTPDAYLSAFNLAAFTTELLDPDEQDRLLALCEPLIDRPDERYRQTDEAIAHILIKLAHRPQAPELIVRGLLADERLADVIAHAADSIKAPLDGYQALLATHAHSNRWAALAIIGMSLDPAPVIEIATREVERRLAPRPKQPDQLTRYVGDPDIARFASVLDAHTKRRFAHVMLERALDQTDISPNRWDSLAALHNIAAYLDVPEQHTLLSTVMEIARGEHADSATFGFGDEVSLASLGLRCAARLSPDGPTCAEIEQLGIAQLGTVDNDDQWHTAAALATIPAGEYQLDPSLCAIHPAPALRALAGNRWLRQHLQTPPPYIAALAHDSDYRVRRDLAMAVGAADALDSPAATTLAAVLKGDARRSVRTLVERIPT